MTVTVLEVNETGSFVREREVPEDYFPAPESPEE